ncbi:MAG: tRNA (adenosine(37)-N6)-threonylcarbamoyltransferase complex ATPase subunit type 1 TsaE, partial [bacterium]|nr:tRNA (adenosine(37)-N6)-threonylcarbamoyltransferase complex ATPase subunit type 1 TsaE [bacterium]
MIAKSAEETQKIAKNFARKILKETKGRKEALVFALRGDLGGGKTTFLQGFAKGLGVKEKITSPTFNIFKKFVLYPVKDK